MIENTTILNKHILILLLLVLIISRSNAEQQLNVSLDVLQYANICNNNQFIIAVKSNEVFAKDSLQGYEIDIRYNPDEITFNNVIYNGTLANQADAKQYDYSIVNSIPKGQLYIQATKFTGYLKGNSPLIIIAGKFNSNCKRTSSIYLNDFIALYDFSANRDEPVFKSSIDTIAIIQPSANNYIELRASDNHIDLNSNISNSIAKFNTRIHRDNPKNDSLLYRIQINDTSFCIIDSAWIDNNMMPASNQSYSKNNLLIFLPNDKTKNDESHEIKVKIALKENINLGDSLKTIMYATAVNDNECSCLSHIYNDTIEIKYIKKIESVFEKENLSVKNKKYILLDKNNIDDFINTIKSERIKVLNIVGQTNEYDLKDVKSIFSKLPVGTYLLFDDNLSVIAKYLQY